MISIFYEFTIWCYALFILPKMLFHSISKGKYRHSFLKRFGYKFPQIDKGDRPLIWIHAVSVGETKCAVALAKRLKSLKSAPLLVISSITETGHAEAKKSIPFADYHVYLPFDFFCVIYPIIRRVKPNLLIIAETDFWFHFMRLCKRFGAKIVLINGKLSERSMKRYGLFSKFSRALFSLIDLFCVQNGLYQKRFEQIGVPPHQIVVTGNTKFDLVASSLSNGEIKAKKELLGISPENKVIVFGSTHDPEEKLFLKILQEILPSHSNVKALIVPRHPERFSDVAAIITEKKIPYIRLSQITQKTGKESVILIDAMGQLKQCYQLANIAVVGGSYTSRIGGHNIVEPCEYGVPVIFGPYMHTQTELVELVKEYHAGLQVSENQLQQTLKAFLDNPSEYDELKKNGITLFGSVQGASERTFSAMADLICF